MSSPQFLITGATGKTGRYAVEMLLKRGQSVRALVHKNDERSAHLQQQGAEIIAGDIHDFMTVRAALEGISGAYFVYPAAPGLVEVTATFAQAAKESSVAAVVNLSQIPARREAKSYAAFNHWLAENVFDWSGLAVTHLKSNFFAETMLLYQQSVKAALVQMPYSGKHAPIAVEDVARLAVSILENPSAHKGKTYRVSGTQEYTYAEAFALVAKIIDRPITYKTISREAAREQWTKRLSPFEVQHAFEIVRDHSAGVFAGTDEVIEKITGYKPMSLEDFIRKNRRVFE